MPLPRVELAVFAPMRAVESEDTEIYEQLAAIYEAAKGSRLKLTISGRVVKSEADFEIGHCESVLIFHSLLEAGPNGVEFRSESGLEVSTTDANLVQSIIRARPSLVYLQGIGAEPVARLIAAALPCPVVFETRKNESEARSAFANVLYRQLLSHGDVRGAFDLALRAVIAEFGAAHWEITPGGFPQAADGLPGVDHSYLQLMEMAGMKPVLGRGQELRTLSKFLGLAGRPIAVIVGKPRSGVSTLVRASGAIFGYMFDRQPVHLDLHRTPGLAQIIARLREGMEMDSAQDLRGALEAGAFLVCIDNFGNPEDDEISRDLLELFRELSAHSRSRAVLGWSSGVRVPSYLAQQVELTELDLDSARTLLVQHAGEEIADKIGDTLERLPRLAGRLITAAEDLRNGATVDEIADDSSDSRSGMSASAAWFMSDPRSVALLRAIVLVEDTAPRDVIRQVFSVGLDPSLRDRASFEEALSAMRNTGVLWVEETRAGGGLTETYLSADREFQAAARRVLLDADALPAIEELECFTRAAIDKAEADQIRSHVDLGWVTAALRSASRLSSLELAAQLGRLVVGQDGPLRTLGTVDEASTALELVIATADSLRDWDLKQWAALMLAERHYRAGDLGQARSFFELSLSDDPTPDTALKASRALGQIEYRGGKFQSAVSRYEDARGLAAGASADFVATLDIQLGKAYVRLNRLDDAAVLFTAAHTYYDSINHVRGRLRAAHELARLEEAYGRDESARAMYTAILVEAELDNFVRFTPGPLYQLAVLELRHIDADPEALARAIDYHDRCQRTAVALGDRLWICLSMLLAGFIDYHLAQPVSAEKLILKAIGMAREKGYGQAEEDARTWLSMQQLPHSPNNLAAVANRLSADWVFDGLSPEKKAKAQRYGGEPWRIRKVTFEFESESAQRAVSLGMSSIWCDCDLFANSGVCTHLAAVRAIDLTDFQRSARKGQSPHD